ncbi:ISAs1 family transposase [Vreelandella subglaciescola]|uniref:Predicted transposase YbfD/YdcC associated with H repeats n=1 Tax=Vreelandella subglaciescola TaxID=29571 RepID=A0A1M7GAX9_9GAMM|nr:ISAs1 family transposase [Halomonas subglaciescola]SHM13097.1 Predicted transposase YbfD/YdcC associated with H repeats [Halomonas subglaciescola]
MSHSPQSMLEVFAGVTDPRHPNRVQHALPEVLTVAACGILVGADTFKEIELWAQEKRAWLQHYLRLPNGIPSHDTFARLFGLMDPQAFEAAFRDWVDGVLPGVSPQVAALDGKTSRRSAKACEGPLHLVSAFAADAGVILGQQATATKSNEKTAIPELLASLALKGCIVTIDAMGTQPSIAQAIRDRQADYVLAVKDNQPQLKTAIEDFFDLFQSAPADKTPHQVSETVNKDHGRLETRRCYVFDALACLSHPERWPDLRCFAVVESSCERQGKVTRERRYYLSSLGPDAEQLAKAVRQHWGIENRVHWCLDVTFGDDQMRARTAHAAHNLAILKRLTLNLIRLDPVKREGSFKTKRIIAATSDAYRAHLLGLE